MVCQTSVHFLWTWRRHSTIPMYTTGCMLHTYPNPLGVWGIWPVFSRLLYLCIFLARTWFTIPAISWACSQSVLDSTNPPVLFTVFMGRISRCLLSEVFQVYPTVTMPSLGFSIGWLGNLPVSSQKSWSGNSA